MSEDEIEFELDDEYPFVMAPQWLLLADISDGAYRLYCFLLAHLNAKASKREVWPSKDSLAALMRRKRSDYIDPQLKELYAIGAVTVEQRWDSRNMRKRNRYTVRVNPPNGYEGHKLLSEWYSAKKEETAGEYVPGQNRVRTRFSPGSVPGQNRVKQEQLHKQQKQKTEKAPSSLSPSSKISSKSRDVEIRRQDVEVICERLADRIEANGSKRPTITKKWRDSARLMLDRDGRTFEQLLAAIDWCQEDEFWRSNILSMPSLRKHYDQLRLAAIRKGRSKASNSHAGGMKGVEDTRAWLERSMERAIVSDAAIARGEKVGIWS